MAPPHNQDGTINIQKFQEIVDYLIPKGYNYFETGTVYMNGECEKAFKECISSKYPRDAYAISNKLSLQHLQDIENVFNEQLISCGVDYFDVYLLHSISRLSYDDYMQAQAFQKILNFKNQGKIKHFGISFHDSAEYLEEILIKHPEIELVQIQFNYLDYDDETIQSKLIYDICCKYHKKIIVMKPNKGRLLASLPPPAHSLLQNFNNGEYSDASYAFRFINQFNNIFMILSCVQSVQEAQDNINTIENAPLLTEEELNILQKIKIIIKDNYQIPCVECGYCIMYCPFYNNIPNVIKILNRRRNNRDISNEEFYSNYYKKDLEINCCGCGRCTKICPQKLPVMELITVYKQNIEFCQN